MNNNIFSLIIPTFNSHEDLERLLSSLLVIKDELDQLEIIVIDDGSCDDTELVVRRWAGRIKAIRYFYQKNKGPAAARNLGAHKAQGEYLIFVDDDCLIPPGFLGVIRDFYQQHSAYAGVGVKTINRSKSVFSEFNQRLGDFLIGSSRISDNRYEYVSSRCYSFVKASFWAVEGHDEAFVWPAAEDRDFCLKLKKAGMLLGYIENTGVINTDHLKLKGFIRQNFLYGLGAGLLRQKNPGLSLVRAARYKDMAIQICKDPCISKSLALFFAFCLAQLCSVAGVILYKINYDYKDRPPSVFLPKHAIFFEIIKNNLLANPLVKSLKNRSGSLTTGEELFSAGYLANLGLKTADVYKDAVLKTFQDSHWLVGKRILEIGPGSHLAVPLSFIAAGADRVVSIDKYGEVKFRDKEQRVYETIMASLPVDQQEKMSLLAQGLNPAKVSEPDHVLNYWPDVCIDGPECLKRLPAEYFDLIVSFNTMEHIKDLGTAFKNMRMILKKGGIFIHKVDATSHYAIARYTKNSLAQLIPSDSLFNAMFSHRDAPTRRLLDDYLKAAEEEKIPVIRSYIDEWSTAHEMESSLRFLNSRFKTYDQEQISKVGFIIVAQK